MTPAFVRLTAPVWDIVVHARAIQAVHVRAILAPVSVSIATANLQAALCTEYSCSG